MDEQTGRTPFDIGAIFRHWGDAYLASRPASVQQRKVLKVLAMCRTIRLGGHLERCENDACGYERPVYNSCGDRHCPKCQGLLMRKWLKDRIAELLPCPYFHCVFTLPASFNALAEVEADAEALYAALFRAAPEALQRMAKQVLQAKLGVVSVLHTWGQSMWTHVHLHCIVTGGGLSLDGTRWVPSAEGYLFDVTELSAIFRERFCRLLRLAAKKGKVTGLATPAFERLMAAEESRDWVVHCKKPFAGPRRVLEYIARYTHRVAITNRRILAVDEVAETVTIAYKDYRAVSGAEAPPTKPLVLAVLEFISRFLRHVLPAGFRKIRSSGLLVGKGKKDRLALCRKLLAAPAEAPAEDEAEDAWEPDTCPRCGEGRMLKIAEIEEDNAPALTPLPAERPRPRVHVRGPPGAVA